MSISSISSANIYAPSAAARQQRAQEKFQAADADGSGGLSLEEFSAAGPKGADANARAAGRPSAEDMFASLDSDGDGNLTQAEMETAFQRMGDGTRRTLLDAQEQAGGAGGPPPGGQPGPGGPPPRASAGNDLSGLTTGSTQDDSAEEDPISALISQLQSAIASYGQKTGTSQAASSLAATA
ncbi:hypothetical protein [Niveispirillum fermenti]|uniref:hypothetical protein n=1 Tax=Niveispirillum fermenti TaxID=1233113 RepID=UPI003A84645F